MIQCDRSPSERRKGGAQDVCRERIRKGDVLSNAGLPGMEIWLGCLHTYAHALRKPEEVFHPVICPGVKKTSGFLLPNSCRNDCGMKGKRGEG